MAQLWRTVQTVAIISRTRPTVPRRTLTHWRWGSARRVDSRIIGSIIPTNDPSAYTSRRSPGAGHRPGHRDFVYRVPLQLDRHGAGATVRARFPDPHPPPDHRGTPGRRGVLVKGRPPARLSERARAWQSVLSDLPDGHGERQRDSRVARCRQDDLRLHQPRARRHPLLLDAS